MTTPTAPRPEKLLYPPQNPIELGDYYIRHVGAMTAEGLHSKADIAEQLAWRDRRIDQLEALAASEPGEESRPFRLMVEHKDGVTTYCDGDTPTSMFVATGAKVTPLFTHPPVAAQVSEDDARAIYERENPSASAPAWREMTVIEKQPWLDKNRRAQPQQQMVELTMPQYQRLLDRCAQPQQVGDLDWLAIHRNYLTSNIEANTQAAKNSPNHSDWSNGVAKGLELAMTNLAALDPQVQP